MLFKGERVSLRSLREEDIKDNVSYMNDYQIASNLEDDTLMPGSIEKEKEWYADNQKKKDIREGYYFAIETNDGIYIGGCGVNQVDYKNRKAVVGIYIGDKPSQNKGYGTEAMGLLLDYLFFEANLHKVKLRVFAFNQQAIRSYEKCGFKVEAVNREALYREGKYHDVVVMGLLKEEYEKA